MSGPARVPREDRLRASDAERDRVIDLLAGAAAEGRLTLEEYSERSETALAARTQGELAGLTADIPAAPARGEVRCNVLLGSVTVRRPKFMMSLRR